MTAHRRLAPSVVIIRCYRKARCAFTLVEVLTTVCVLIILLGLMVSLARNVRQGSATQITGQILGKLDGLMSAYLLRNGGIAPDIPPLFPTTAPSTRPAFSEAALQSAARINNEQVIRLLRGQQDLAASAFSDLSIGYYDERTVRDAWGSPIVFMPGQHPAIGMAPRDRFFFFSAGPDRLYLTREDNLYSYDSTQEAP